MKKIKEQLEDILKKNKESLSILKILAIGLIAIKILDLVLSPNHIFEGRIASFGWIDILLSIILGGVGIILWKKIGYPEEDVKKTEKTDYIFMPLLVGLSFGIMFVIFDNFAKMGDMNVGFPTSILFYTFGAVTTELITHVFPIAFIVYFARKIKLIENYPKEIFLVAAIALSDPSIPINIDSQLHAGILMLMIFTTELFSISLFKKYGIVSPIVFRLGFYLIWHIIWPNIIY